MRVDAVQFAGLDQRSNDGPVFGSGIVSGEEGGTGGRIASLIETAKINGVDPYAYLKATLEALAEVYPKSRIDKLLPWIYKAPSSP